MSFARSAKIILSWNDAEFMPKEVADIVLQKIKENCAKHIGSLGKQYEPNKRGNPDWRESGRMLDGAITYRGGKIKFFTKYAVYVNRRYPFLEGFSVEDKKEIAERIKPIIAKRLKKRRA